MPSAGMTAPIQMGDAFAQAAAEVIGPAILLQDLLEIPVTWGVDLFAADLPTMMMTFGSPESYLLQLASAEVNAYLHGRAWQPWAANLHTGAKCPGEKVGGTPGGIALQEPVVYPEERNRYAMANRKTLRILLGSDGWPVVIARCQRQKSGPQGRQHLARGANPWW